MLQDDRLHQITYPPLTFAKDVQMSTIGSTTMETLYMTRWGAAKWHRSQGHVHNKGNTVHPHGWQYTECLIRPWKLTQE